VQAGETIRMCFWLWREDEHPILDIHQQTVAFLDIELPARRLRHGNLVSLADFDRGCIHKLSLLSRFEILLSILPFISDFGKFKRAYVQGFTIFMPDEAILPSASAGG
jgi:hypothetical protein